MSVAARQIVEQRLTLLYLVGKFGPALAGVQHMDVSSGRRRVNGGTSSIRGEGSGDLFSIAAD